MECPWYLGLKATEECIKKCPINEHNRDIAICPIDPDEELYQIISKNYAEQNSGYLQKQIQDAERKIKELERDDVPLISLDGYAETHEELKRMVQNCEHELEEARQELVLARQRKQGDTNVPSI